MKLSNIFYNYLNEQEDDDTTWEDFPDIDPNNNNDDQNIEPYRAERPNTERSTPHRPLTPNQIAKARWKEELPGLTNDDMNMSISAFNARKSGLKPFKGRIDMGGVLRPDERDNSPEVVALMMRYPSFPNATDVGKLKNPASYSWEQFVFILQKLNENLDQQINDLNITGRNSEEKQKSAYEKWTKFPYRNQVVVNDGTLIVIRVESVDEAIALGEYQDYMRTICNDTMNRWCITHPISNGGNLYTSYRGPVHKRAYYFIMDKSRDICDKFHISVLQPSRIDGPYVITNRKNVYGEERKHLSWDDVLEVWPGLEGKENLITYFDKTNKENGTITLNSYNLIYGSPNDLAAQTNDIQTAYVHEGRDVNSARVFSSFTESLKEDYIKRTTLTNYTRRYMNDDPNKPFGMIQTLNKNLWSLLHNQILKGSLGIQNGIFDLYRLIIRLQLRRSFYDIKNDNIRFFENELRKGFYGVMDLSTLKNIKEFEYQQDGVQKLVKYNDSYHRLWKYKSNHSNDHFYWLVPVENERDQSSPNYLKAHFLDGPEGDQLLQTPNQQPNRPNRYNPNAKQYGRPKDNWGGHDTYSRRGGI